MMVQAKYTVIALEHYKNMAPSVGDIGDIWQRWHTDEMRAGGRIERKDMTGL